MMYEEVIQDFARRTLKNLKVIEQLNYKGEEVFETTQLVNSCLGLLVFPQQKFLDQIPNLSRSQLRAQDWPIPRVNAGYKQVRDLKELIRKLRNAISHFNIEFIDDAQNEISFLKVWCIKPRQAKKSWQAEFSVDELRRFILKFSELLINPTQFD